MFDIRYDPEVPGCLSNKRGEVLCELRGQYYTYHGAPAYRIVWEGFNGKIPEGYLIDHINRDKLDNRIENLRLATKSQNGHNCVRTKRDGLPKGITKYVSKITGKTTFKAMITIDHKTYQAKFDTLDEAADWRDQVGKELLGEFYIA